MHHGRGVPVIGPFAGLATHPSRSKPPPAGKTASVPAPRAGVSQERERAARKRGGAHLRVSRGAGHRPVLLAVHACGEGGSAGPADLHLSPLGFESVSETVELLPL